MILTEWNYSVNNQVICEPNLFGSYLKRIIQLATQNSKRLENIIDSIKNVSNFFLDSATPVQIKHFEQINMKNRHIKYSTELLNEDPRYYDQQMKKRKFVKEA